MAKIAVTLESAKERFTLARKAACSADRLSAALYERLAAETLLAAKGQPAERAATMFFRMAVALEVLTERKGCLTASRGCRTGRGRRGRQRMPCSMRLMPRAEPAA